MPVPKHAVQTRQMENKKNLMSQVTQPKSTCVDFLDFLVSKSQLRCVSSSSSSLRLDGGPSLMISTSDADVEFRLKMLSSEAAPASTSSATGQRLLYMFSSLIWTNVPSVSYNENLSPFSPFKNPIYLPIHNTRNLLVPRRNKTLKPWWFFIMKTLNNTTCQLEWSVCLNITSSVFFLFRSQGLTLNLVLGFFPYCLRNHF